jgi:transposase
MYSEFIGIWTSLSHKQKETAQQISYEHTLKISQGKIQILFYDVTTLYFETDTQDDMRKTGFSKEGRHSNPQILLGLLIGINGYPLAYEIYEGNKYEGATMLPVIEEFVKRFKLEKLIIVADSGLLNANNISELQSQGYEYIIGARIKSEKSQVREQILGLKLKSGESSEIERTDGNRLIISYSDKRAKRDEANRSKGILKLEKKITSGKLTKSSINNKGYNKFLSMQGSINVKIDYEKIKQEEAWDGLKGYITNTQLSKEQIIEQYSNLWNIEKAFRIAKSDLRIRPIYHRLKRRIQAHICIAFCAYKVYKELERQLKLNNIKMSAEKAIEITNTIYKIDITTPSNQTSIEKLIINNEWQKELMKILL